VGFDHANEACKWSDRYFLDSLATSCQEDGLGVCVNSARKEERNVWEIKVLWEVLGSTKLGSSTIVL
jgi:hypothetical protein